MLARTFLDELIHQTLDVCFREGLRIIKGCFQLFIGVIHFQLAEELLKGGADFAVFILALVMSDEIGCKAKKEGCYALGDCVAKGYIDVGVPILGGHDVDTMLCCVGIG